MTFSPPKAVEAGKVWTDGGGVLLGIRGDSAHVAKGWSYHLGSDDLAPGASSARLARDKKGLSLAASAIDLGKLNGTYVQLREFSEWLVDYVQGNGEGTRDIREVIYSPDGKTVWHWDRERGVASKPVQEGDDSHLTHTHISWYRDSEFRDKTDPFKTYFEEKAMRKFTRKAGAPMGSLVVLGPDHFYLNASTDKFIGPINPTTFGVKENAILGTIVPAFEGGTGDRSTCYEVGDETAYLLATDVKFTPYPKPVDCAPLVADAIKADRAKAKIVYQ